MTSQTFPGPAPGRGPVTSDVPWFAAGLHVVGQRDVIGPDVVLPLPEAEHAAEDAARVDAHPHVQLHVSGVHHGPGEQGENEV